MIKLQTSYTSAPQLLGLYLPKFKSQHFHLHGGSQHMNQQDVLLSIFQDDSNQLHQGARKMIKGALIGLISGFFYNMAFGPRQSEFLHTRSVLNKLTKRSKLISTTVLGAMYGFTWWAIHDLIIAGHGSTPTLSSQMLAYSLQGGIMVATLYHPAAFGYGMASGCFFGMLKDVLSMTKMPKNFQLYFKDFDKEKRSLKLQDDQQHELSMRSVLGNGRVFHPI